MASRTQIRLQQVTGSLVNLKTEAQQYVTPAAVSALTGSDLQDVLGAMAASLNRIHGAASDEPFNNTAGVIRSQNNAAAAIKLHADAGSAQTIQLLNDEGTSSSAIDLTATLGGFSVDGVQASNITVASAGDADDLTISVTGATDSSLILSSAGTAADALQISTSAGGMDITVNGAAAGEDLDITADSSINITSSENAADSIKIESSAGGIDILASGAAAGEDIDITATGSSVNITSTEAAADAIVIDASGNGGIDITAGNAANDANANLDIVAMNNLTIDAQGTDNGDGINITLGSDNANTALRIKNDSDSEKFKVDALGDVTVGRNLTVAGNLDINGTTTTIDTVNLSVQDSIIALGVSGSGAYSNLGDRGILFPRGASPEATKPAGLWWDNTQFNLAKTATGPLSASFQSVAGSDWAQLKAGNLLPGVDDTYDLGSTSLAWQDLHLEGDVLMTDAGRVQATAGAVTVASTTSTVISSSLKTSFNFHESEHGVLSTMDAGGMTMGFILSSSAGNGLIVSSNDNLIELVGGEYAVDSMAVRLDLAEGGKAKFEVGKIDSAENHGYIRALTLISASNPSTTPIHEFSGSLALKGGSNDAALRIFKATEDAYVGFDFDGTSSITYSWPNAPAANDYVLISQTNGTLSWVEQTGATTKGVYVLTASHGSNVNFRISDNAQRVAASDSIGTLALTDAQGKNLDVFVNGQLLMSGSSISAGANQSDYKIQSSTDIRFAFDLEIDDIVQIVKRG